MHTSTRAATPFKLGKSRVQKFPVLYSWTGRCTEVCFVSFGGFTTMTVINPPERKLAKRTSVQWEGQIMLTK